MTKKNEKSLNVSIDLVSDNADQKPLGRIYHPVLQCLTIIVLYLPLIWYVLYLRKSYSHDTIVLSLDPLHLIGVISLLIGPLFILHLLGINWRNQSNEDGS